MLLQFSSFSALSHSLVILKVIQEQDIDTTMQTNQSLLKYMRLWIVLLLETLLFNRTYSSQRGGGLYRKSRSGWKELVLRHLYFFFYGNSVCTFYPVLLLIYNIELNPAEPSSSSGKTPKNRKVNITIAHLNVCSIASHKKFFLVKQMIVHGNYDIFVISESWFDPSLTNNDIQIPGYVIFRQDRSPHKSGGGIVVYIRNSIKALTIDNWSTTADTNSQHFWLKV